MVDCYLGSCIYCYRCICGVFKKKGNLYIFWNASLYNRYISLESTYAGETIVLRRRRASCAELRGRITQPSARSSSRVIFRGSSSFGFCLSSSSSCAWRICSSIMFLRVCLGSARVAVATGASVTTAAVETGAAVTGRLLTHKLFRGAAPRQGKLFTPRSTLMGPVSVRMLGGTYFCPATVGSEEIRLPMRIGCSLITGVAILFRIGDKFIYERMLFNFL